MRRLPQALDVTDESDLDGWLPPWTDAKLTAEALVIGRLVAEDAGCGVMAEHLRRALHARLIGELGARHKGSRLADGPLARSAGTYFVP
jgi:hypothetical protein